MTRLTDALQHLGLDGDIALGGRWVTLRGEHCLVYVAEATRGGAFYTWCDAPDARSVERYTDPITAVQAGLRRAAQPQTDGAAQDH